MLRIKRFLEFNNMPNLGNNFNQVNVRKQTFQRGGYQIRGRGRGRGNFGVQRIADPKKVFINPQFKGNINVNSSGNDIIFNG